LDEDTEMVKHQTDILASSAGAGISFPIDRTPRQRHAAVAIGSTDVTGMDMLTDPRQTARRICASVRKRRIAATPMNLKKFKRVGKNCLVHKATQDLWQLSPDGKTIQALYDNTKEPLEE